MTPTKTEPQSSTACTKCETGTVEAERYPLWCKQCKAKYQREWQACRKEMSESRGYAAGVSAFRAHIVGKFRHLGNTMVNSQEAAEWVRSEPFPLPKD